MVLKLIFNKFNFKNLKKQKKIKKVYVNEKKLSTLVESFFQKSKYFYKNCIYFKD